MIDDLGLLRAFTAVMETGSFSEAGRRLGVVPSTISKQISTLEARLGGQLVARSTKGLSVNEVGRRFYERCLAILYEVEQAESEIGAYRSEPQGLLRVSAATVFAQRHLMPMFTRFMAIYPKVQLDISLSTVNEDLVSKGVDVAIRISNKLDPGLIQLKLARNERVYCASAAYLAQYGVPAGPEDIQQHNCLVVRGVNHSSRWPIRREDGEFQDVTVSGTFTSDNGDILRQALLAGAGIGHLPRFMVQDHIDAGELLEIFPESRTVASHIYAIYPDRRNLPLKTRAFLNHLKEEFRIPPKWAA